MRNSSVNAEKWLGNCVFCSSYIFTCMIIISYTSRCKFCCIILYSAIIFVNICIICIHRSQKLTLLHLFVKQLRAHTLSFERFCQFQNSSEDILKTRYISAIVNNNHLYQYHKY